MRRRALKKADEALKDDEALQSMTDGQQDSGEKSLQSSPQVSPLSSPCCQGLSPLPVQGSLTLGVFLTPQVPSCLCGGAHASLGLAYSSLQCRDVCVCCAGGRRASGTPEGQRRSDPQGLPRPYSPPIAHLGSSGQPWHELQEQPPPHSDTSDPWEDDDEPLRHTTSATPLDAGRTDSS